MAAAHEPLQRSPLQNAGCSFQLPAAICGEPRDAGRLERHRRRRQARRQLRDDARDLLARDGRSPNRGVTVVIVHGVGDLQR